jgi:hypothetical protein
MSFCLNLTYSAVGIIEVFYVNTCSPGPWGRDNVVEEAFYGGEIS